MIYIKELILKNFRCYLDFKTSFDASVNVIVGKNAVGKTSLVEAIYVLGLGKSFKTKSDRELINHNHDFLFIKGFFEPNQDEVIFSVSSQGKKIKKNSKEYRQLSEHLGYFNVVMFTPDDLDLIKGGPGKRRSFMDINLSQFDKTYVNALIKYKQLLKQRNEILKNLNKYNLNILEIITEGLIDLARQIISIRDQFLQELSVCANEKLQILSNEEEQLKIVYKPSCNVENLWKTFQEKLEYDILTKTTTTGPHRDEFIVYVNNKEVGIYGSQGQQRSVSLALKLGFSEMIKKRNKPLIIILDDVFSELDDTRQNQIFRLIKEKFQIFITTTSISGLDEEITANCKLIELKRDGE